MHDSTAAPERVRTRFEDKAQQFDDLYEDERWLVRTLRPGLFRRRKLAVDAVRAYGAPRVLDVGCGSGRIGEFVLEAGASHYVGVDFSEPMIELARQRLARYQDQVELITDDFLAATLSGPFDVVLAVGLFDYLPNARDFSDKMFELTAAGGCLVASFPSWSLLKGPIRKVRYEWIGDCPIFNYTRPGLQQMFAASGFTKTQILTPGHSGFLVKAYRA